MQLREKKIVLLFGDILLMYGALVLTMWVRFGDIYAQQLAVHMIPFSFVYVLWLVSFYILGLYDLSLMPSSQKFLGRFLGGLVLMIAIGSAFFYLVPTAAISPKTNLVVHVALFGGLVLLWRSLYFRKLATLNPWRIGIFGEPKEVNDLHSLVRLHRHIGFESVTFSVLDASLPDKIRKHGLHVVVLPNTAISDSGLLQVMYATLPMGTAYMSFAQAYERFSKKIPLSAIDQRWFLNNVAERHDGLYQQVKRLGDFIVALLLLTLTFPIWILIALAIKIEDRGHVFYSQRRVGKNNKLFSIIKFRSMRKDAEAYGAQWAQVSDARVTRLGKFLRASHLDELPQLINVLRGDISLVGPRPERPEFVTRLEKEVPHYHVRHLITPGFTGWAQINFRYARSVMDSREKFEYDLYYIKNRSLFLDLLIILKTARLFFPQSEG
jgi:exopolysaccharide biosynthesis polyprenyl glycosylphosphotransferase